MNKEQKELLATLTCGILDRYADVDEYLKAHGISKRLINKINKAFDLISEVNQSCFDKNLVQSETRTPEA
jgi:hypothetical protein